jgi:hypothetical protein
MGHKAAYSWSLLWFYPAANCKLDILFSCMCFLLFGESELAAVVDLKCKMHAAATKQVQDVLRVARFLLLGLGVRWMPHITCLAAENGFTSAACNCLGLALMPARARSLVSCQTAVFARELCTFSFFRNKWLSTVAKFAIFS